MRIHPVYFSEDGFIINKMKKIVESFIFLFFMFSSSAWGVRFYIDIESRELRPYTVSVRSDKKTKSAGDTLLKDLLLTPYFEEKSDGEIVINIHRTEDGIGINAVSGDEKFLDYFYSSKDQNFAAHSFANLLLEKLTGRSGPFGTLISYISNSTGKDELVISHLDGGEAKTITSYKNLMTSSKISPVDFRVVFCSYFFGNPDIFLVDIRSGTQVTLLNSPFPEFSPAWSPDGKKIAFSSSYDGDVDIYIYDLERKTRDRLISGYGIDVSPSFSPDGKFIAFTSDRGGSPQIYLYNVEKKTTTRLTFIGKYNASPVFSPDGTRIAFVSMRDDGWFDIGMVNADGTGFKILTDGTGSNESPDWSPDGRFLIFSRKTGKNYDLYILHPETGFMKKLFETPYDEKSPSWSRIYLTPDK